MTSPVEGHATRVAAALERLDPEQRAELTAGASGWSTLGADGAGLAPMLMGDGPLGLVSPTFDERDTARLLLCGTALGATWDPDVVAAVAGIEGAEARSRGYAAVYAPNLNLARTGLSGRTFEMLSEDPFLTGVLGAAFVRGVQAHGVAACPKHLVANDTETERQRMSATVDDASLREVYLQPFERALLDGGAWMVMTAYNALNGVPCGANADLISIVKDEWGWDGLIVSDYFALKETIGPALAGLDLEMPGPAIHLGAKLGDAVRDGRVPQERIDDAVTRLLGLACRVGALDGTARQIGDDVASFSEDPTVDQDEVTLTTAAAASFVLVKNEGNLLPLETDRVRRIAVIGPNADRPTYQGATFGRVRPAESPPTPLSAITQRFDGLADLVHEPGVARTRPEPLGGFTVTTLDGTPGLQLQHFRDGGDDVPVLDEVRADSTFTWFGTVPGVGPTNAPGRLRLTTVLTPDATGTHLLGAGGSGETTLLVDGVQVAHKAAPSPEDVMGQVARAEMTMGSVELTAGVPATVVVEMRSRGARVQALNVACLPPQPPDALESAVRAAHDADAVILVVGDVLESSRESRDLDSSALPVEQVELISAVAAANPRTVVVVNAGRPVAAPWADQVDSVLYAWLPGERFGTALAKVVCGDLEPGGRMPVTVTVHDEDRSTWGENLDADLALDYTRTEPNGYRHLQRTQTRPRFSFGSGTGYTRFEYGAPRLDTSGLATNGQIVVTTPVTNVGDRPGREVVQVYVRTPGEADARLAGFAGVSINPGESADVTVVLDQRAFARWDVANARWMVHSGTHGLLVGHSSTEIHCRLEVNL